MPWSNVDLHEVPGGVEARAAQLIKRSVVTSIDTLADALLVAATFAGNCLLGAGGKHSLKQWIAEVGFTRRPVLVKRPRRTFA